jgi:hypothetical protein
LASRSRSAVKIHDRISIHSISFPTAGIDELCRNGKALQARRVSFSSLQVLDYGAAKIRNMLDAAGQKAETVTHVFCAGPLRGDMQAERGQLARAIEAAAMLGARSIWS